MDRMDRNERDLDDATLGRTDANRLDRTVAGGDTVGDEVGEAAGGISGVLAGAALGSLGGPLGTIIGGLAGAVSGWWAGRAISEAASHFGHDDDAAFRTHYEASSNRLADRSYDDVRPAYQLGHLASRNPDYANRNFDEIETDLRRGWTDDVRSRHGEWESVRGYARDAYDRGKSGAETAWDRTKQGAEGAWDKTKQGAERLGDKVADGADDVKDRVDGNPASRPGPDVTDRQTR